MDGNTTDAAVARLARHQHGLVTTAQLRDVGLTTAAIRHRIAAGRWHRVDRGVVRIAGLPVTWESEVLGRVLAAGPGAVASHRTAAVLWQLDGFRPGRPELSIPRGRRYRRPGVGIHELRDLDRIRPTCRSGIPVTPVERTLLDLGMVTPPTLVTRAVDDARHRRLTDWDRLLSCLVVHARQGRSGSGTLRAILDRHFAEVAATESGFERLVYVLLVGAGLAEPVLQHEVSIGGRTYRLDLAYPDRGVGIELDGSVHLRRDVWERDHARQNALILAGWTLLRFTWRDYTEHPNRLVSEVRTAVGRS